MNSTRITYHIKAPRTAVYRALLDAQAVAKWKVPDGMTCQVHAFDAREGGAFRISLSYDAPTGTGKTTAHTWQGSREMLLAQLVRIVEQFIRSDRIVIKPPLFFSDELRRRLVITLNMSRVVQHVWEAIRQENTERLVPVFDRDHPIRSTGEMRTWYTGKPCERTRKSHINVCVYDSTWEASDAFVLDNSDAVAAWVKNDHIGFEVLYVHGGVVRKYRPDFLVRLTNGEMLVLETKGQDTEQDKAKRRYLDEWTQAVNAQGGVLGKEVFVGRFVWHRRFPAPVESQIRRGATCR